MILNKIYIEYLYLIKYLRVITDIPDFFQWYPSIYIYIDIIILKSYIIWVKKLGITAILRIPSPIPYKYLWKWTIS